MPSLRTVVTAATALALASIASADYSIDPESVPLKTRERWCQDQKYTCPMLCQQVKPGTTLVNECDAETLTYGCLCGNNKQPNISEYSLTLPYWVCTQWVIQCQDDCGANNNDCKSSCVQDHPCGASSPTRANGTSTATTATTPSATGDDADQIFDGPNGGSGDDDDSGAASLVEAGRRFGLGLVVAGLAVVFGVAV
jgi:hypothetical protein